MAQHPGNAAHDRRQRQSVAIHLCGLYLAIEVAMPLRKITTALGRLTARTDWPLLPAPLSPHWLTVVDVAGASELNDHAARVERWARSVWEAWAPHHRRGAALGCRGAAIVSRLIHGPTLTQAAPLLADVCSTVSAQSSAQALLLVSLCGPARPAVIFLSPCLQHY